jgi:hypothetical protein
MSILSTKRDGSVGIGSLSNRNNRTFVPVDVFIPVASREVRILHEQCVKPSYSYRLSVVSCRACCAASETVLSATYFILQSGGSCVAHCIERIMVKMRHGLGVKNLSSACE